MADVIKGKIEDEEVRVARLLDAQSKAVALFVEVEARSLIAPGQRETAVSDAIRDLAAQMFGVERHWHKRIVRSGPNTLQPYRQNPPDRVIGGDDIVFCDFGPIFQEWEADFGRTYVLGDDPAKTALRDALPGVWSAGRDFFRTQPEVTGAQLFTHVAGLAREAGYEFGGPHAGHLVGEFPHERIAGDEIEFYITTGSDRPMRRTDRTGRICHWILEMHLVDRERQIGGFYEELLDLGTPAAG
jgi:Xaa-Pro aminopeptidase